MKTQITRITSVALTWMIYADIAAIVAGVAMAISGLWSHSGHGAFWAFVAAAGLVALLPLGSLLRWSEEGFK